MKRIFSLRIATKIFLLIAAFIAAASAMTWLIVQRVDENNYFLRENHIRDIVATTVSQLEALQAQVDDGALTQEEAIARGTFLLNSVSYDNGHGYMFASDYDANVTAHPRQTLMGTNQWDLQDPTGMYIYREIINIAKNEGGGTLYYVWDRKDAEGNVVQGRKLSYALPFEPWGWMVGTGVFVTDVEAMTADLKSYINQMIIGVLILTTFVGVLVALSVSRPVNRLQKRMQALSDGDFDGGVPYTEGRTEIAGMARSILLFRDALKEKADVEAREAATRAEREAEQEMQHAVVGDLAEGLNRLASGDLQAKIPKEYTGVYEKLRLDYNKTVDTLRELIGSIMGVSQEIEERSRGIHDSAHKVARRSEQSSSTLEQTSAALEDLTTTVTKAADSADEVDGIVKNASRRAENSGHVVSQAVDAMQEIETSSIEIANVTSVIDDIAFQTNLLALNAGVEAARAGESGQGFAVVASEVRALAARASDAASEIKNLIKSSGESVSSGSKHVGGAGTALAEISESVSQIRGHVEAISAGTREQSLSLTEINEAVADLDLATQQNTAMFQETLVASDVLTQKANELAQQVAKFDLGNEAWESGSAAA